MEKLHELHQEGRYDLLVLDTPPTRHALDFLDAPRRLRRFIDSRSLKLFTGPGRVGRGAVSRGAGERRREAQRWLISLPVRPGEGVSRAGARGGSGARRSPAMKALPGRCVATCAWPSERAVFFASTATR